MSEAKLISPMLDHFAMGTSISEHHGVHSYPAMDETNGNKYIVKVISIPASRTQLDALLLSGAYPDEASAQVYFKEMADGVVQEIEILESLSKLDGFISYDKYQTVEQDAGIGYDVYLLGKYRRTLERQFQKNPFTHLGAINLGLDLCSALMVCRRAGYLYTDLRPSNVYLVGDNAFRIGDLGFLRLDGLKYASLPDKYRSQYTAPEIADAFSELNTTIDVYAVGLILYQAYNGGALPFTGNVAPAEVFPAPAYADYEMAEIILKACAPDPADRWEDPMVMGQALVTYMQRNGANDTPIVPPPVAIAEPESEDKTTAEEVADEETASDPVVSEDDETIVPAVTAADESPSPIVTEEPSATNEEDVTSEEETDTADEDEEPTSVDTAEEETDEDLKIIDKLINDDDDDAGAPIMDPENITYDEVSDEISQMLTQIDEIANHQVPDPVVQPEAIDVPIPDPIITEPEDETIVIPNEDDAPQAPTVTEEETVPTADDSEVDLEEEEIEEDKPRKKRHWVRNSILIFLLLAVIAAGFFFYNNYYLVPIEAIVLDGSEDSLVVQVTSDIDETLLTVICSDPHGNQIISGVVNGTATFTNLVPDTAYTITIEVNGFHKLTGDTSKAYSTPVQTNIVQFSAITGAEDGSVILGFTVDGPDSQEWDVVYSARGENEKTFTFSSHMATITGLTVGKEYTFKLVPKTDLYITGNDQITYTAAKLVYPENLWMSNLEDGKLTVQWTTPDGMTVESWSARCYNSNGYNETIISSKNEATFENIDLANEYTIEVTAAGMSVSERLYINKDSVAVSNFVVNVSGSKANVTWDSSRDVGENGWIISYTINGVSYSDPVTCTGNYLPIDNLIPASVYDITFMQQDGTLAIGGKYTFTTDEAEAFSRNNGGIQVNSEFFEFTMCKTPKNEDNWNRFNLSASDYTTSFRIGEKASFLVRARRSYGYSEDPITSMYIVRDTEGNLVCVSSYTRKWSELWYLSYCELNIPKIPAEVGSYVVELYWNGQIVHTANFSVYE